MNSIAKLKPEDRKFIFLKTSESTGKSIAIIEKDYWICYLLDYLFTKSEFRTKLIFKGGTSLSKGYDIINRMSEDIDLILDCKLLGNNIDLKSLENDILLSKNKLNKYKKIILDTTNAFLVNEFLPKIQKGIEKDLGFNVKFSFLNENGGIVICFHYPKITSDEYLLDVVKLEIGPIAASTPTNKVVIKPYCFDKFDQLFVKKFIIVETVTPERTFWEKATILHKEALRPINKKMPLRYFRHYYDLVMLANSAYKKTSINDIELLKSVIHFKDTFYKETWMDYRKILTDGIRLVPDSYRISELKQDYYKMKEMIDSIVQFDELLFALQKLENEINMIILKK